MVKKFMLTRPAKIKHKPQQSSQEVVYGGDLKVDCVASGLPNPEISWALPDGTMVNPVKQRDSVSGGRSRRYEPLSYTECKGFFTLMPGLKAFSRAFHHTQYH